MNLLAISGSLRHTSSNTNLLLAAARLAPPGISIQLYDGLDALPHFNPDIEAKPPAPAQALRDLVGHADGLLICSPEYAHGVPGSLKNALDWLVGGPEFVNKPLALLNASPRAVHAQAALREIVATMSAMVVEPASITVSLMGRNLDVDAIVNDPEMAAALRAALTAMAGAIEQQRRLG